jgi:transcriptional regulator GlxA family with amidase domain
LAADSAATSHATADDYSYYSAGDDVDASADFAAAGAADLLRVFVAMIGSALDADLGVAALAARAGVSDRHLSRLFVTSAAA